MNMLVAPGKTERITTHFWEVYNISGSKLGSWAKNMVFLSFLGNCFSMQKMIKSKGLLGCTFLG